MTNPTQCSGVNYNFQRITGWKIETHAIPCVTNPETVPENLGRKSGALRNAFRNPKSFGPDQFSGLLRNACLLRVRVLGADQKKSGLRTRLLNGLGTRRRPGSSPCPPAILKAEMALGTRLIGSYHARNFLY